jgi:NADH-quinone oxidoreductase subunit L
MAIVMILYARNMYITKNTRALEDDEIESGLHRTLVNKYWFDEIYDAIIRRPVDMLSIWLNKFVENKLISGIVDGSGDLTRNIGGVLRGMHSGQLVTYILAMVAGLIALLAIFI